VTRGLCVPIGLVGGVGLAEHLAHVHAAELVRGDGEDVRVVLLGRGRRLLLDVRRRLASDLRVGVEGGDAQREQQGEGDERGQAAHVRPPRESDYQKDH
jgi:hypothetical protein